MSEQKSGKPRAAARIASGSSTVLLSTSPSSVRLSPRGVPTKADMTSAVIWQPSTSSDVAWRQVSAVSLMASMRVGLYGRAPPPNSLMSRSPGKWRCQVSAGLCALPTREKYTACRSGQAALMKITVVSGIATFDGPRRLVNFGDARHILSNVSAVTQLQYKSSVRKPPFVLRTNASSAAILSGEIP